MTSVLFPPHEAPHSNRHLHNTSPPCRVQSRRGRCHDEDDDDRATWRPMKPTRRRSQEDWERSMALAKELQVQDEERRRQEQLEQEKLDISLAMRLMDESLQHEKEYLERDSELARSLQDEEAFHSGSPRPQEEQEEQGEPDLLCLMKQMEDESKTRRFRGPPLEQLLEPCQQRAVTFVKERAKEMHDNALPTLLVRVVDMGFTPEDLQTCLEYVRDDAPIVIHISEAAFTQVAKDTHYRNLFEVHTSGGCKDKNKRQRWEATMFANCYDESCPPFQRPKYGCLNVTGDICGVRSAHRYGQCYLTLHEHVRERATFFDRDSGGFVPERTLATKEHYAHILNGYNDKDLQAAMNVACNSRIGGALSWCPVYKEVQIHGPVGLATDIQAVTLAGREADASPEFRQAVLEFQLKTNCNVLWQMDLLDPQPEYRF